MEAEEVAQEVRCLLHKHQDLNLDPQHPCKSQALCCPSTTLRLEGWRQKDSRDSLARKPNSNGK